MVTIPAYVSGKAVNALASNRNGTLIAAGGDEKYFRIYQETGGSFSEFSPGIMFSSPIMLIKANG